MILVLQLTELSRCMNKETLEEILLFVIVLALAVVSFNYLV